MPSCRYCHRVMPLTRGMCAAHYKRWLAGGDLEAPIDMRYSNSTPPQCSLCDHASASNGYCRKHWHIWRRYGEEGLRLMAEYSGFCGLCGAEADPVIDHDHETGQIRGLICGPCNTGLGLLGDTVEGVCRALDYLRNGG
jgi:hypothetical protein